MPGPICESIVVPILPNTRHQVLRDCHDLPSAGHLGTQKILEKYTRRHTGQTWLVMLTCIAGNGKSVKNPSSVDLLEHHL